MERLEYRGVKVKCLQDSSLSVLEGKINEFLGEVIGFIMDIKCYFGDGQYNATIIYIAEEVIEE